MENGCLTDVPHLNEQSMFIKLSTILLTNDKNTYYDLQTDKLPKL